MDARTGGSGSSSTNPRGLITTQQQYTMLGSYPGTNPITTKNTYDIFGNTLTTAVGGVLQSTAAYSATTEYSAPDSVTVGSGSSVLTTSYLYNFYTGAPTNITDPNNGVTQQTYDALLRPLVTTRPDGKTVSIVYDDTNRIVTATTPFDGATTLTRETWADQLGRAYKTQSPIGTVQTIFDPLGRTYQVSNPFANGGSASYWTTTKYDALSRTLSVTTPDGISSTLAYGSSTSVPYYVTSTDGAGKQKMGVYNGIGQMTSLYEPDVTQQSLPLTVQTSYVYTALNSLLTATQGAQTRSFAYDGLNRPTSVTTPEAGTVYYAFDTCSPAPSNLCSRTDARGVVTSYTYDGLNRSYQIGYNVSSATGVPATPTVTYSYGTSATNHNNGRLIGVTDGSHIDSYTYDPLGHVLSAAQTLDGQTYTTQYTPNDAGLTKTLTYPSGTALTLAYATDGTLNSIKGSDGKVFASSLTYNTAGQVTNYTMGLAGGNVSATLGYSLQNLQLQSLTYATSGSTMFSLGYGNTQNGGNNGQITSITDYMQSGRSANYGFDALNRLTAYTTAGSTSYPTQSMSWSYDRYGNRLTQVQNANTLTLNPSPTTNRLSGYSYDAAGNMTNDGHCTSVWDAENRMLNYCSPGVTNEYDAKSLRVRRTMSGGSDVVYVFSGTQPLAEYAAGAVASSPSTEYVYLGKQLLASKTSGAYTFYLRDHLSIRQILADATPNSPTEQGHLPFGESWYGSGTKWIFSSYERDPDVGDDYALARRYQYSYGRFNSPDPIGGNPANPQSFNRYTYVQDDPLNSTDPSGMYMAMVAGQVIGGGDLCWLYGCGGGGGGMGGFCDASGNCSGISDPWANGGQGGYVGGVGGIGPNGVTNNWGPGWTGNQMSALSLLQQGLNRYLSIKDTGWDPALGINWNNVNVNYLAQANGQYNRLSGNLANVFGPGVTADPTNCDLIGGHCNFLLNPCDSSQTVCPSAGRYDDGIHIENMNGALWVHDDTVSPWTGQFTFGALFTGNFWEHGFVDLIGGTFFVGAFSQ